MSSREKWQLLKQQAEKRQLWMKRLTLEQAGLLPGWGRMVSTGSRRCIGPWPGVVIFLKTGCGIQKGLLRQAEERPHVHYVLAVTF